MVGKEAEGAARILEVVPRCLRFLRREMRAAAQAELTVPQFRILAHVSSGTTKAAELAEMQGVSVPAMSRMVDGLVRRGFLSRSTSSWDRRRVVLKLTPRGVKLYDRVRGRVQENLAELLRDLPAARLKALEAGLQVLGELIP